MEKQEGTSKISALDFHQGQALLRIADQYPTLVDVVLEQVQNAIDANATIIVISINSDRMRISIRDNGDGVTKADFEKSLTSICQSIKIKGKLGRFGIGLISPLGKCERFTFMSCPKGTPQGYLLWKFDSEKICAEPKVGGIPFEKCSNFWFVGDDHLGSAPVRGVRDINYRTAVEIYRFTLNRSLGKLTPESLGWEIVNRYSVPMRRNKVAVQISITDASGACAYKEVRASDFTGTSLSEEVIHDSDAGDTKFRLFLAKRTSGVRKGKIQLGEINDDYRIDFRRFADCAREWLSPDIVEALTSGVFEGEILSQKAKIHVSRKAFEQDKALVGLCCAIDGWFKSFGKRHLKEAVEMKREERYQILGRRSLNVLEKLFQDEERGGFLRDVIEGLKYGRIGKGHADPDAKILGETDETHLAVGGEHQGSKGKGEGEGKPKPETEHPKHVPITIGGPGGRRRTIVKSNSLGITIIHDPMEGSDRLWRFDPEHGIIYFNIRHPQWVECESDDNHLMRLQEHLMVKILLLHTVDDKYRAPVEDYLELMVEPLVYLIKEADVHAGRKKPPRKKRPLR